MKLILSLRTERLFVVAVSPALSARGVQACRLRLDGLSAVSRAQVVDCPTPGWTTFTIMLNNQSVGSANVVSRVARGVQDVFEASEVVFATASDLVDPQPCSRDAWVHKMAAMRGRR